MLPTKRLRQFSRSMAYRIRFKREALKQLDALYQYIAEGNPESGRKILERVHVVFVRLGLFPLLGHPSDEGTVHVLVVGKTGLLIFYTFNTDTVTIVRILHERQERN